MRRYNKFDASGAGHGALQRLAMHTSHRRYDARKKGTLPPLEYLPLNEAIKGI